MKNILRTCAKLIAGLLALLFVFVALIALFLLTVNRQLLNPQAITNNLREMHFFARLPSLVADQITYGMNFNPCAEDPSACENEGGGPSGEVGQGGPPAYFQNLSQEDWEFLLSELFPPEWLGAQTEGVIHQLFEYLKNPEGRLSMTISLVELKDRLKGEAGARAIRQVIEAQPPCAPDEIEKQLSHLGLDSDEIGLPNCRPPEEMVDELMPAIGEMLGQVVSDLPDETDLAKGLAGGGGITQGSDGEGKSGVDLATFLRWRRRGTFLAPLASVLILILIAIFGVRSVRELLQWWGAPLLVTGLIGVVMAMAAMPGLNWLIHSFAESQRLMGLSPRLLDVLLETAKQMASFSVIWFRNIAGLLALIGILLVAVSFFVRRRTNPVPSG